MKPKWTKTSTWQSWQMLRQRCTNPKKKQFKDYGGRGISCCERWDTFTNFLEDMGEKPKGYQIDRIDVNGNYCKENCRWVSPKENANNRRNNRILVFKGESKTIAQWAVLKKMTVETLRARVRRGWSVDDALTLKVDSSKNISKFKKLRNYEKKINDKRIQCPSR